MAVVRTQKNLLATPHNVPGGTSGEVWIGPLMAGESSKKGGVEKEKGLEKSVGFGGTPTQKRIKKEKE